MANGEINILPLFELTIGVSTVGFEANSSLAGAGFGVSTTDATGAASAIVSVAGGLAVKLFATALTSVPSGPIMARRSSTLAVSPTARPV